jgi:putative tryptophan/tyrosine transport system substrate-binding protein
MNRRAFITLLGGAGAWPIAAGAQQRTRLRRIGVFMPGAPDHAEYQARNAAFLQGLGEFSWTVGRTVEIEYRWGQGDSQRYPAIAAELVALTPEVILGNGTAVVAALLRATQIIPIVFVEVVDPVGGGLVDSLARPGGNATGFAAPEFGFSSRWLELLKEIAPRVQRAAVLRDASIASQIGMLGAIQSVAPALGLDVRAIDVRDPSVIEQAITGFAREPNGGLIIPASARAILHGTLIAKLAAMYRLPTVYQSRSDVAAGGLVSYGANQFDQFRRAAGYVDRILKGTKPADLPVQAPVTYELVINMKTAKALGLDVPDTLLATADEVIE